MNPHTEPDPGDGQAEADLLARGRDLVEDLCGSTRYRHLYPEGPNLALLLEAYQELDRKRAIGRVGATPRGQRRAFKRLLRRAVRRDVLDRNRRLSYGYPTPRLVSLPVPPPVVDRALARIDPDLRPIAEAHIGARPSTEPAPGTTLQGRTSRALEALRLALLNETLANPSSIPALHPQYLQLIASAQPTRRRHPIASLLLVKLPLQLLLILVTLFNLAYIGGYFFFNDEVLGRFVSSRVSGILDGDLEMGSIHWEGRLIFDLLTGTPTRTVVRDVTVWEPYKSMGHERLRKLAHAERVEVTLVLHEIIPWNRLGIPTLFEIPWILHFGEVRIDDSIWVDVRGYHDTRADGTSVEVIGLIDAFRLHDFEPPAGSRGLSFAIDDAVMNGTSVVLDFQETAQWRTAITFDQTRWHLRFDAPRPDEGKPVKLPLRFAVQGEGGAGVLEIDDVEVPLDRARLDRFAIGIEGAPVSDIAFAGEADAAGSHVLAKGVLGDALTRSLAPTEPLPADTDADYGAHATVTLEAATRDAGPLADQIEAELGLAPDTMTAQGSPATARVDGPLRDPTYQLAVQGMSLDILEEPAWAADDVYLSLTMERTDVPGRWADRFEPGTKRRIVTFDTLRGAVLDGSFKERRMAEPAHVVMPATSLEPYLIAGEFELAAVDPGRLAPEDAELAQTMAGTARGGLAVHRLVVGPQPIGPELPPGHEPQNELRRVELGFDDVRWVRDRGPRDDDLPRTIRAEGRVVIDEEGAIDLDNLLLSTDGTRLRVDGGVEGDMKRLRSTLLDLRVDDGRAFARAFDLPPYFERLRSDITLLGPIRAPSGRDGRLSVRGVGGSTQPTDASIWMDGGVMHLRAPNAHLFGGHGRVELDVVLFERGGLSSDPKVRAYLDLDDVEISEITEVGPRGKIDLELDIDDGDGDMARLSEIRVHGLATAPALTLGGTSYRDVALAFRMTPEELAIDRLVLSVHHPVSPRFLPELTVPIGRLVADGTVSLEDDPALDVAVEAEGIPLHVVFDLLELELPLHGKIARGTSIRVGGHMSRPIVEGTLALAAVSAEGIRLGDGQLEFTSEDFDVQGPLAAHRELRVRGELSTRDPDKIQWTVDSVIAIGQARRRESPPVAAQLDVGLDQISIPTLMQDPLDGEDHENIEGRISGVNARVLTCNPGPPMLSDCVGPSRRATAQTLAMQLSIDDAWVRGTGDPVKGDPCDSPTTLCSQERLVASIDWPMVRLERPWTLATGGPAPAELELQGDFDLSEPPASGPPAKAAAVARQTSCGPPPFTAVGPSILPSSIAGRGHAKAVGTLDFEALAPLLRAYGLEHAHGQLDVELSILGHLMDPKVTGSASVAASKGPLAVNLEQFPFPIRFEDLDMRVGDGWLLARGELGVLGESLRFGSVDGEHTGYALTGDCAGSFGLAARGVVGHRLIANLTGAPELTPGGSIDVPRLVIAGHTTEEGMSLEQLEGRLELDEHSLKVNPTEGLSDVELVRGRVDFERCGPGSGCDSTVEDGTIALYVGGSEARDARSRPSQALEARVGQRGEAWAWGRTYIAPDLHRASNTQLELRLADVPYRDFDPRGTLVYEAEVSSDDLQLGGGAPLVLHGTIDIDRTRYVKDAVEGVEILRLTDEVEAPEAPPPEMVRSLQLDLRVETERPARVENNVASGVEADLVLDVTGTWDAPEFSGRLDVEPGGEVDIPFVTGTYQIQRGRVTLLRDVESAEVDILAIRQEPIYIDGQARQIQLLLGGTLSAVRWSCLSQGADATAALDTVRGCTEYLVLGAGDVQVAEDDVQRVGGGGLASARKPLQVVGHLTELDIGKRAEEAAPRYRGYVPDARLRLGQIGPELEISTPQEWFDFEWGRATLGWDYTRGYPGFLLRQSRETKFRLEILDPVSVEFSRQSRDYLNERIIFDPLEQVTLELRFDLQIPSLR